MRSRGVGDVLSAHRRARCATPRRWPTSRGSWPGTPRRPFPSSTSSAAWSASSPGPTSSAGGPRTAPRGRRLRCVADARNDRLVWIDFEMTGLDPAHDAIVEIAAHRHRRRSQRARRRHQPGRGPPDRRLDAWTTSWCACTPSPGCSTRSPPASPSRTPRRRSWPTCRPRARAAQGPAGRLERLRRPRLPRPLHARARRAPALPPRRRLHVKELARRWYPRVYFNAPAKNGNHRALGDIRESIAELRYYRDAVFVAAPGPSTDRPARSPRPRRGPRGRARPRRSRPPESGVHSVPARAARSCAARHGGCSSAGRAPGCGPGGRGFKSRHSPHVLGRPEHGRPDALAAGRRGSLW